MCRVTPVTLLGQTTWGVGQMELRQHKALPALELLPLLCLGQGIQFIAPLIAEYRLQHV